MEIIGTRCPTCKSTDVIEVSDIQSYQFHEEIKKCASCDTLFAVTREVSILIQDSAEGSFLDHSSATTDGSSDLYS
jgi:Zn ribbon nucleic-acid-binding protein